MSYKRNLMKVCAAAWCGLATLFAACDNQNNSVGVDILPDYTKVTALSETFLIDFRTVSADLSQTNTTKVGTSYNNIYVNSGYGYLGEIPNKEFGAVRSEYMTQFYCPAGFKFRQEPLHHKVDSAFVTLYYSGYSGDSIAPIEITAHKLKASLPFAKYSISDISPYVDLSSGELGKVSYHAGRGHGLLSNGLRVVQIPLPTSMGQEFYDRSRAGAPVFSSQEAFNKYFPGIYLYTSAGSGSVIKVMNTSLSFYYSVHDTIARKNSTVKDSVIIAPRVQELSYTSEVPQLSRFANMNVERLLQSAGSGYAYIKSPAGVLTEVTIPTVKIKALLDAAPDGYERILNSVHIRILGEKQSDSEFALKEPGDLLMLPKDSVASFFEREQTELDAPYTSFMSTRVISGSLAYDFGNITSVILNHIEKHPAEDLVVLLVPVERTVSQQNSGTQVSTSVSNLVLPSALKISTSEDNRKIKAIVTQRKKGAPF